MLHRHTLPACTFFDAATTSFWGTRKCHSSPRILPQLLFCSYKVGPLLVINEGKTKPLYKCPYEWVNGGMLWLTSCSSCYGKPHLIHECMVYIYIFAYNLFKCFFMVNVGKYTSPMDSRDYPIYPNRFSAFCRSTIHCRFCCWYTLFFLENSNAPHVKYFITGSLYRFCWLGSLIEISPKGFKRKSTHLEEP